ncbi:hypothetical protein CHARACLAT_025626 [Characodon lateralis]|uniref:Uncharacterized protein n=1 Tax=Characodon lateralis TaxID=208331 RepID=A0ABU7EQG9_9TELE|nr:hypothetical protein [Characodon lateralis]
METGIPWSRVHHTKESKKSKDTTSFQKVENFCQCNINHDVTPSNATCPILATVLHEPPSSFLHQIPNCDSNEYMQTQTDPEVQKMH